MKPVERWLHLESYKMGASAGAKGSSAARHAGILYHRKFYKTLDLQHQLNLAQQGLKLLIEPWFESRPTRQRRSPDAVLLGDAFALVIEVKLNWRDGRDEKLLDEYLPIVGSCFGVPPRPLMVCGSIVGLTHKPLLSISQLLDAALWQPGDPTPTLLWTGK